MQRLDELFDIYNGVAANTMQQSSERTSEFNLPLMRPAKKITRSVAGYVNKNKVKQDKIFPAHTIYVSTDGEGSHSYSYVSTEDFIPNSNVAVLIPKEKDMSLIEKLFYSMCITKNRYKFSYGRKPKGKRLVSIMLPSRNEIPSWVYEMKIPTYDDIAESKTQEKVELPSVNEWKSFTYDEIFNIKKGNGISLTEAKKNPGNNAYVTSTCENNGVAVYTSAEPTEKANTITVNTDGSIGYAFYHTKPYLVNCHVAIYDLKERELNSAIAMFLITLIQKEQYKYNFGRAWGVTRMKKSIIKLPVTAEGKPDYDLMERYINSLPYSKYI